MNRESDVHSAILLRTMLRRIAFLILTGGFAFSLVFSVPKAAYWRSQELAPFHRWSRDLETSIPRDARILLVVPESQRFYGQVVMLNTSLAPRPCYLLHPGATTAETSGEWIQQKRLTWMVSLGGTEFDPARAYSRPIHVHR